MPIGGYLSVESLFCASNRKNGMNRKILIMGLPGAGKTTLSRALRPLLGAVAFNADDARAHISKDLGFSHEDRIEQARRMGWMCDRVVEAGGTAIADFVCPTPETRAAFGDSFVIWVDRIRQGRFEDTNRLFVPPERYDLRIDAEGDAEHWAKCALSVLRPGLDPSRPAALFLFGCRRSWMDELPIVESRLRRGDHAYIAFLEDHGESGDFEQSQGSARRAVANALEAYTERVHVMAIPPVSRVYVDRHAEHLLYGLEFEHMRSGEAEAL